MGLFDTSYGDVSRGTFTTSIKGRGARNPPLTIWDAIDAANLSQIPGISDAASLALAGRDVSRGDYGSAGLNALGGLPFVPALAGIFIGKKGMKNMGLLDVLQKAEDMKAAGASDYDIWQATAKQAAEKGVRGGGVTSAFPDKQPRFEIDDSNALWKTNFPEYKQGSVSDFIDHPTLEQAHPDTMHLWTEVNRTPERSGSLLENGRIDMKVNAPSRGDARSVMLHELQHAVQGREGFARGGSPEGLVTAVNNDANNLRTLARQAFDAGDREKGLALEKEARKLESMTVWGEFAPNELYRRLAGEAEARLVQKRMNYTPEMREAAAPWQQFDVPIEQQIVRGLLP